MARRMSRVRGDKLKRRKKKVIDPVKEEATAKRIAVIQAKRQKIIDQVHLSLLERRMHKREIQNAHEEKEERARDKKRRDAEADDTERQMLQMMYLPCHLKPSVKSVLRLVIFNLIPGYRTEEQKPPYNFVYDMKPGRKAAEAARIFKQVFDQGSVTEHTVQFWFKKFRNDRRVSKTKRTEGVLPPWMTTNYGTRLRQINAQRFVNSRKYVSQWLPTTQVRLERQNILIREDMSTVIETGIKCVYTAVIIPDKIKYDGRRTLTIHGVRYRLRNNLHLVGWGKEAVTMSSAFERVVGKQLKRGWMVVPRKSVFMMWSFPEAFPPLDSHITYVEAGTDGHPDEKSVFATRRIINYCKKLKRRDLLIVMLSQGVDDLLCCPREEITLRDKLRVINRLKAAGATDDEINTVRNKLSAIRGGDLARFAYPARVVTLITSDVSSVPMTHISGGPCVYDPKDLTALAILVKYRLLAGLPMSVRELAEESIPWAMAADKQVGENGKYRFVHEYVIACNADAMECMSVEVFKLGFFPVKLNSTCSGTVQEFAKEYVKMTSLMILGVEGKIDKLDMYEEMKDSPVCPLTDKTVQEIFPAKDKWGLGLCLLLGGRQTVNLCANPGKGGPNQELALYFSLYWYMRTQQYPILREYTVWFLGGSSYGVDGNTPQTGAFGYKSLATDVFPEYEKAQSIFNTAYVKWWQLKEDKRNNFVIADARKEMEDLEVIRNKYAAILPGRVLKENNTNLFFLSINHEDELLELKTGNYYTFTNVGDLHIIRIVRFQCNCDGVCHGTEEKICPDRECPVNRTLSAESQLKTQYCCRVGRRKDD